MTDKKKHAALALLLALLGLFGGASLPSSGSGSGSGNSTPNESGNDSTNESGDETGDTSGDETGDETGDEDSSGSESESPVEDPDNPEAPDVPGVPEPPEDENDESGDRYDPDPERHRDEIIGGDPEGSEDPVPPSELPVEDVEDVPAWIATAATFYAADAIRLYEAYQDVQQQWENERDYELVGGPPPVFASAVGPSKLLKLGKALRTLGVSVGWIGRAAADDQEDEDEGDTEDDNDEPTYTPPTDPDPAPSDPGDTVGGGGSPGGVVIR